MAKTDEEVLPIPSDTVEMERALLGDSVPEIEDPEAIARAIMVRIMQSENLEQVFEQGSAVHARDVLGRPFRAHDLRFHKSSFEQGPGVFAVVDAEFLDDGTRSALTVGGRNVMAQLLTLKRLGQLPQDVKIEESEGLTAAGYKPLWLHRAKS